MGNRARTALILAALVAVFFAAEAAHFHGDGAIHDKCPLCIAAHSPSLSTTSAQGAEPVAPEAGRIAHRYTVIVPGTPDFSLPIIRSPTV